MKKIATAILISAFTLSVTLFTFADDKKLSQKAKISMKQAKAIALKAVAGKIIESELEVENGKLVYSIEIKTPEGIKEVEIDALDGTVLSIEDEDDDDDDDDDDGDHDDDHEKEKTAKPKEAKPKKKN